MSNNLTNTELEVLNDYFIRNKLADKGWTFESFAAEWKQGYIGIDTSELDARLALSDYKDRGERVDEVLFQVVTQELDKLHAIITQKNREYDSVCEHELKLIQENNELRASLAKWKGLVT